MLDPTRIRAICFDVDGTLADTDDALVARLAGLLDRLPLVDGAEAEALARRVVMAGETPVNRAYGLADRLGLDDELAALKARLAGVRRRQADPGRTRNPEAADEVPHAMVPDVREAVLALARRYPMCTISTGGAARVEAFLRHYGVRECFAAVVTAQTTPRMKPYPDPLRYAAAAMGVPPHACVMVGDTTVDVRCGRAAGAQTVGVLCGFGTEDELRRAGADLVLRTTADIVGALEGGALPPGVS